MTESFPTLEALATHLRQTLQAKKCFLLYAHNGTGKTRLSTAFKDLGKSPVSSPLTTEDGEPLETEDREQIEAETMQGDTLYFNAFTEDLFSWENDLLNDSERYLKLNTSSSFFDGLESMEMDNRVRPILNPFGDFDFKIDTENWVVRFSREFYDSSKSEGEQRWTEENIKISRGEERIFTWCFFLAIAELALDESEAYDWVKYIYVDDPITSLDDQNAITVASNLAKMLKTYNGGCRFVISTHHNLFFNVLFNELGRAEKACLSYNPATLEYGLEQTGENAVFGHIHELVELKKLADSGKLEGYHFNRLRSVLERTAVFHGHTNFSVCLQPREDDHPESTMARIINILSHGSYDLYSPRPLAADNQKHFKRILEDILSYYPFNPNLFTSTAP